jgi:acetolactate synthase-1/2/3 large subunit
MTADLAGTQAAPRAGDGSTRAGVTVARAILGQLADAGVTVAFGLPGVHNLAFWQDGPGPAPAIIGTRHEQTTVYAADGLARASGGLGVALTTTGPGAANAVAAFGEAASCGSPVLLIASEIATTVRRPGVLRGSLHESADQAAIFAPLAKAVLRPRTAADAVAAAAAGAALALQWPRGPVYVDIPADVLGQPAPPEAQPAAPPRTGPAARPEADTAAPPAVPSPAGPRRAAPVPAAITAAAALIAASERIVLWVGGGAVQSGAEAEVTELAERLGCPVLATWGGRGVVPAGHPLSVDLPPHEPEAAALLTGADLLIAVGSALDGPNTKNWTMPMPPALLTVNADPAAVNYEPDVAVTADAATALRALLAEVAARPGQDDRAGEVQEAREAGRRRLRADATTATACALVDAVDAATASGDATVINDMAIAGYWVGGYGSFRASRRMQYPVGWGTLGYALPAAVGAGALRGRPVLAVCGDGGFMFAVGELAVLAEYQLPVTVLLVDDGGYGMLRFDQEHSGDAPRGADLVRPDFAVLAAAFGIGCAQASLTTLAAALTEALASSEPRIVLLSEQLYPPRTVSARWSA